VSLVTESRCGSFSTDPAGWLLVDVRYKLLDLDAHIRAIASPPPPEQAKALLLHRRPTRPLARAVGHRWSKTDRTALDDPFVLDTPMPSRPTCFIPMRPPLGAGEMARNGDPSVRLEVLD
jgi:hypothetical protein